MPGAPGTADGADGLPVPGLLEMLTGLGGDSRVPGQPGERHRREDQAEDKHHRRGPGPANWGSRLTKNTAIFGLPRLLKSPRAERERRPDAARAPASSVNA